MDRHLVAVEVGVERGADQRMDLQRLALDEHRLERLDAQAVQRRRAVEQYRMLLDDVFEDVPHLRATTLDHPLRGLDVLCQLEVDEPLHDERLEQLERHQLGQAALVQAQRRAGDDDRTTGVVDALAEQVLTEPALLALEHVGQRLQRAVAGPGDRAAAAAVVEQRVDGLLQHPLLVVDDDLGGPEVEQALQPVVAVDHPAVQVVEVRRGEATAVELDHRAQLRRDHRDGVEDHRLGIVRAPAVLVAPVERGDDLQPLDRLLLALRAQRLAARVTRVDRSRSFCSSSSKSMRSISALIASAPMPPSKYSPYLSLHLAPEHLVFDDLAGVQALELVEGPLDEIELDLVALADALEVLVRFLLQRLQVGVLGVCPSPPGPRLLLELLEPTSDRQLHLLLDRVALFEVLGLEGGQRPRRGASSSTQLTRLAAK